MHTGPIAAAVLATIDWAEDFGLCADDWHCGIQGTSDSAFVLFDALVRNLNADRRDFAAMRRAMEMNPHGGAARGIRLDIEDRLTIGQPV